jgi:hypothetical protein
MPGINFLDNQKKDDQKPKDKDEKKGKLAWSEPQKEIKDSKKAPFSFLSFINKKEPADKNSLIDKNKIKQSREEILNLIKHHEISKPPVTEKNKNFIKILGEKIKKQPSHKEILIDYQRIFNQEREHKNKVGDIFNIKPAAESQPAPALSKEIQHSWFKDLFKSKSVGRSAHKNEIAKKIKLPTEEVKPAAINRPTPAQPIFNIKPAVESNFLSPAIGEPKRNWLNGLIESFKNKIISLSAHRNETIQIIKSPEAEKIKPAEVKPAAPIQPILREEEKPAEAKEINIKEKEPIKHNEIRQRVLETNLIQGELITFFDWRSKIIILLSGILIPIFMVGAVYYGLVFYQKSNQAKNLAQAQKFAELEQNIAKEEADAKEIAGFQAKLKTVSQVFSQHLYWTNFFKFLEDNTIKDVYFINFDGDTSGNYVMDALAANYSGISEQVNVFKNNKKITAVEAEGGELVNGDDINESLVKFVFNFSVVKNIFTE